MAETIIGKMILGAKMQIGNEDNTFEINPHGLSVYDPSAKQEERIFLGIEDGKAVFRLHSKDGNNKLVLSEDGIYQVFPIQARDSFDYQNPFKVSFYLPKSLQRLDEARLIFNNEKFRAYSKGATVKSTEVVGATAQTNGAISNSTKDGGATSKTVSSTTAPSVSSSVTSHGGGGTTATPTSAWGGGGKASTTSSTIVLGTRQTSRPAGSSNGDPGNIHMGSHTHTVFIPNHSHSVSVNIPSHSHSVSVNIPSHSHRVDVTIPSHNHNVTYNIPAHSHKIDISGHSHLVDVTIPSHKHDIVHGIYEYGNLARSDIYVDGVLVLENVAGDRDVDISQYIQKDANGSYGGTHTIEVRSRSTTSNPEGLGRANMSLFISGFVSF